MLSVSVPEHTVRPATLPQLSRLLAPLFCLDRPLREGEGQGKTAV